MKKKPVDRLAPYIAKHPPDPFDLALRSTCRDRILETLKQLTPREEKVIKMRYGLGEYPAPMTLEDVSLVFAVTRERIRQIEAKALRRLRHPERSRRLKGYIEANGWRLKARPRTVIEEPPKRTAKEDMIERMALELVRLRATVYNLEWREKRLRLLNEQNAMNNKPKIIKKEDKPVHPDLRRLARSMSAVLVRRYPDPAERQAAAQKIMREVKA